MTESSTPKFSNLPSLPIQSVEFAPVADPNFLAEYAVIQGDLVFHFFAPEGSPETYWTERFPAVLETAAKEAFHAEAPRLQAQYVSDWGLDSWWMRAYGFGNVLDPRALATHFLTRLGRALER